MDKTIKRRILMAKEDEIRLIAYTIWEEEGCPHGKDCEHWQRAEVIWEQKQKAAGGSPEAKPVTASKPAFNKDAGNRIKSGKKSTDKKK
jgi:hypothetical protein